MLKRLLNIFSRKDKCVPVCVSGGEYIVFMDGDDYLRCDEYIRENPECGMTIRGPINLDEEAELAEASEKYRMDFAGFAVNTDLKDVTAVGSCAFMAAPPDGYKNCTFFHKSPCGDSGCDICRSLVEISHRVVQSGFADKDSPGGHFGCGKPACELCGGKLLSVSQKLNER